MDSLTDARALNQLFSLQGAAWTTTAIIALVAIRVWSSLPSLLDKWLAYRAARAAEKAADWSRIRDEVVRLSEAEDRCRRELADVTKRLASLEGYEIGRGEARQEAQRIVSSERQNDKRDGE